MTHTTRYLRQLCAGLGFLGLASGLYAEDWPQFRGPTGQGHSTEKNLPISWQPNSPKAWKQAIPGGGWSSPVIRGGRIYLTTAVETSSKGAQSLHALCLEAKSGKILWNTAVFQQPPARIHSKNSHASATPWVDDERLYVHFGPHGTAALDLEGEVIWRQTELTYKPTHGNGGSPVLSEGALFMSCDGADKQFVVALDAKTGKILWKTPRPSHTGRGFSFSTPLVIDVEGTRQIVSAGSDWVAGYEAKDGKEIWRVNYPSGYSVVPRPVYGHGLVFVCSGYDSPSLFAIRPDGKGDVTRTHVAWTLRRGVPHNPSPLLVGDALYVVSDRGIATCLDAKTGKEHWKQRLGGNYSASPVYAEGRIYFQNEAGDGVVIEAATTFKELGRSSVGERTLASYAIADGALFLRAAKHLYRIEKKGTEKKDIEKKGIEKKGTEKRDPPSASEN